MGTKEGTKKRYLLNYYSSGAGVTAEFESASNSFGNSDGAYAGGMSAYNGSSFGSERASMNQKIPVTMSGQGVCEIETEGTSIGAGEEDITIIWGAFMDGGMGGVALAR